jgi:copper chaperone CopZ
MDAVHIKTAGFYCKLCPKVVEKAVGGMDGVEDVVSVQSLGITSVLFDPEKTNREKVCARIKAAGFKAEVYCPPVSHDATPRTDDGLGTTVTPVDALLIHPHERPRDRTR